MCGGTSCVECTGWTVSLACLSSEERQTEKHVAPRAKDPGQLQIGAIEDDRRAVKMLHSAWTDLPGRGSSPLPNWAFGLRFIRRRRAVLASQ